MSYLCFSLVLCGAFILGWSIIRYFGLLTFMRVQIYDKTLIKSWIYRGSFAMMLFFFIGYIVVAVMIVTSESAEGFFLVSLIFFMGSIFVLTMVSTQVKMVKTIISKSRDAIDLTSHWYKSILDSISLPISVTDANMNWTFVNKAVEDFLGKKLTDMLGKPCYNWNTDICNTENCGVVCAKQGLKRTFFQHEGASYQVDIETLKDLTGNITGFVEIVQDITQVELMAKKQADAEAASIAKSVFLANMSHEIRTPMNAVLGMAELLLEEKLNHRQLQYAKDIQVAASALLEIINDILDVSKIQSGKLKLVPVHYDFNMMIENIDSITQFMIKDKNIDFLVSIPQQSPVYLFGDNVRLRQVIVNLIGNAIKFTEKGYVLLNIRFTDQTILITVEDTGMGIPKDSLSTLFDAFEQADVEKNRDKTGTGLGLTISKSIIEMMGGQISVESIYGKGSAFTLEIPMVLGDETQVYYSEDKDTRVYAPDAQVLVVDDNVANLNVASGILRLFGITAEIATSGEQAIELIQQKQYDIVFMDQRMPELSGAEATMLIRVLGIDVTIIALTASVMEGKREMLLAAGMNDFLMKPIVKSEMHSMLKKWIPAHLFSENPPEECRISDCEDEEHKGFWQKVEQIAELDLCTGLERIGGQHDVYEKTLQLMRQEIDKSVTNLPRFLSQNDMQSFRIEVHSIKGALANIGSMGLSEQAYELEKASANKNSVFCQTGLPALIMGLSSLNRQLTEAFAEIKQKKAAQELPQELTTIFKRMARAFQDMDLFIIETELQNLDKLNIGGAAKDEVEQIKDLVMIMDYDSALERMYELLCSSSMQN